MRITCEINLFKPPDYEYRPGSAVRGVVKYVLSEDTQFSRITVSLKGNGRLQVTQTIHTGKTQTHRTYDNSETYVDIDSVVLDNTHKGIPTPSGTHEIPFSFELPINIPSNFKYNGSANGLTVYCKIGYYIRIKFERPGFLNLDKRFKSKIKVGKSVTATLPSTPVTHGMQKKPFQPFTSNDRIISINGTIENSVAHPGGHVKMSYKVNNSTKLDIKDVKVKLAEEINYKCNGKFTDVTKSQHFSTCKATPVKAGEIQAMELAIDIPSSVATLQHSKLVSRDYFIEIIADLPMPHRKAILKMPVEILENASSGESDDIKDDDDKDSPPSYYEAMQECKKGELD